jgi:hypothetical protein
MGCSPTPCPFVSSEAAFRELIIDVLQGGNGAPEDLVIDDYNEAEVARLARHTREELVASFLENRNSLVRLVRGMQESDLEKVGRHPFLGMAPLQDIIKLIYRHNQIHLRDMRRTGLFDY